MTLIESTHRGRPIYRVRWNVHRDDQGKLRYDERRFSRKADAVKHHREVSAGHTTATETITVRQLAALWFDRHVDTDACQQRTRKDYRTQYELRIKPYLDRKAVAKLTPRVIAEWRTWMQERPTGARTVNKSLDTLKTMIRWGRSEGLCANTMIDDVRRVKTPPPKPANPYSPQEVAQIVAGCQYLRDAAMIQTAAYGGLRWSELRALRWADVDLETGEITLVRSLDLDMSDKPTKSNRERIVPVLAPGVKTLKQWRKVAPDNKADLVFPTRNGRPLREDGWYGKRLPKIREACGIHFDLHELRDTYASILIATGVDAPELTLWLGHRSIQTTLNRYAQLFKSRRNAAVRQANRRLKSL